LQSSFFIKLDFLAMPVMGKSCTSGLCNSTNLYIFCIHMNQLKQLVHPHEEGAQISNSLKPLESHALYNLNPFTKYEEDLTSWWHGMLRVQMKRKGDSHWPQAIISPDGGLGEFFFISTMHWGFETG
jgi:hypothetical protein